MASIPWAETYPIDAGPRPLSEDSDDEADQDSDEEADSEESFEDSSDEDEVLLSQ